MNLSDFVDRFNSDYDFAIDALKRALNDDLEAANRRYFIVSALKNNLYDDDLLQLDKDDLAEIEKLAQNHDVIVETMTKKDADINNVKRFSGYTYQSLFFALI